MTGRGGQGSKLLLPPGLSWAEPRTFLGLSLYRKWELSALLGAGAMPSSPGEKGGGSCSLGSREK